MAYLKTIRSGKEPYYVIAESYREEGVKNPKTRVICNLGKLDNLLELAQIRSQLEEGNLTVIDEQDVKRRFGAIGYTLDERMRRLWAATEALIAGKGGISMVSRATGISRRAITEGVKEIQGGTSAVDDGPRRIRRAGGGRKKILEKDPKLKEDLDKLIEPTERGDPMSPLRWTIKSLRRLADELQQMGHKVSHMTVGVVLVQMGFSLQGNRKTLEGKQHKDRDAQFKFINDRVKAEMTTGNPVISIDCKKKENIGEYKNQGTQWRPGGDPRKVKTHDFPDPKKGKVAPFGIFDLLRNEGFINLGISYETSAFAVESIRRWWYTMGKKAYARAKRIQITCDCGGSNGNRRRLWKVELQKLANELGLPISICHLPPGTSKWNKIEHRMFSFITSNWRGEPLESREVVINFIRATTTETGLTIQCELDLNSYPKGIEVTDAELDLVKLVGDDFHPEWNYTIHPI